VSELQSLARVASAGMMLAVARAVPAATSRARACGRRASRVVVARAFDGDDAAPAPACPRCRDAGKRACDNCKGNGYLPPGGFHAKNAIDMKNAVGTKWTAHRRTRGWRHFECVGASPKAKTLTLRATCDTSVTVDVPVKFLRDRMEWSAGWKQKEDLDWTGDADQPGGAVARPKGGATCAKCAGAGTLPCDAEGCQFGLVRIERQRAVIEKTEAIFKRQLEQLRERDDDASKERRAMLKKQLNVQAEMRKEERAKEIERKRRERAVTSDRGGGWADYRNAKKDELLEEFLAGARAPNERDTEAQQ